ncbi:uncharacterized protein [Cherax quadricarinatus]
MIFRMSMIKLNETYDYESCLQRFVHVRNILRKIQRENYNTVFDDEGDEDCVSYYDEESQSYYDEESQAYYDEGSQAYYDEESQSYYNGESLSYLNEKCLS